MKSLYQHIYENNFYKSEISEKLLINKNFHDGQYVIFDEAIEKYIKPEFTKWHVISNAGGLKYFRVCNFFSINTKDVQDLTEALIDETINEKVKNIYEKMLENSNNKIYGFTYDTEGRFGVMQDYEYITTFLNDIEDVNFYEVVFENKKYRYSILLYETNNYNMLKIGTEDTGKLLISEVK